MEISNEKAAIAAPAPAVLAEIRSILGEGLTLLPIHSGTKKPKREKWTEFTSEVMGDPEYLKLFEGDANVGVITGSASNGLCAIDLDDDEALEEFLVSNPELRNCATVRGKKGAKIFIITNENPPSRKISNADGVKIGEFLGVGQQAVVHGLHPEGPIYEWICKEPPMKLSLKEVVLPDGWMVPWVKTPIEEVRERFGRELSEGSAGGIKLNQRFFAALVCFVQNLIYHTKEKRFYCYKEAEGIWSVCSDDEIRQLIDFQLWCYIRQVPPNLGEAIQQKRTDAFISSVLSLVKMEAAQSDPFGVQDTNLIHFLNGVYDMRTRKLREFCKEDYFRSGIPFEFVEEADCQRFVSYLGECVSADDLKMLQMLIGAYLIGPNTAQIISIIYGAAGVGKSTLIKLISLLIGPMNIGTLRPKHINSRFEVAQFRDKRLLLGPDVPRDFLNDGNALALKSLTGGDPLSVELKGSNESFEIEGNFNVLITGNARPRIHLDSDRAAWGRRLFVVRVIGTPPKKPIPNFSEKLIEEEGPGIIQWAVEGAHRYQEQLKTHGKLVLSERQKCQVNDLLMESESLDFFVSRYIGRAKGGSLTVKEIQETYAEFCAHKSWSPLPDREFSKRLPDLMQEHHYVTESHSVQGNRGEARGYRNVALSPLLQEFEGFDS